MIIGLLPAYNIDQLFLAKNPTVIPYCTKGIFHTTLARRFAEELAELRIIKTSCFKECCKSDYVGQYVGHTAAKIDAMFEEMSAEDNYRLPTDSESTVKSFFQSLRAARGEQFGNGREARNLYINAKQHHALKIGGFKTKTQKCSLSLTWRTYLLRRRIFSSPN